MALRAVMVSDLTGKEGDESDFTSLVVRSHPAIDEPKKLDVLPEELAGLKEANNLVVLEIGENGNRRQVVVTLNEFRKICDDEIVTKAAGTRGRRPGTRLS